MEYNSITEKAFLRDFKPLSGFYDFHVRCKRIHLGIEDVQNFGVRVTPHSRTEMQQLEWGMVQLNSIDFSSWRRSHNIKNLMWALRCLESHPENIKQTNINGTDFYIIECFKKNHRTNEIHSTMKGIISCEIWPSFREKLTNLIKNKQQ